MAVQLRTTDRNAMGDVIIAAIGTSGLLRIYDGTPPANVAAALSGNTLLATCPLSSTFAPATSSGVITANTITTDPAADNTGTASFFRVLTSGATAIWQGTVTATGGGGDLTFASVSFTAGIAIGINTSSPAFTLTMPGA